MLLKLPFCLTKPVLKKVFFLILQIQIIIIIHQLYINSQDISDEKQSKIQNKCQLISNF